MSRTVRLVPGARWFAGVDLPWWLPTSLVTSGAEDMGFSEVTWHERSEALPVDPRSDGTYSDGWDQWATGIYRGPERDHAMAWTIPWLVGVNPPPAVVQPEASVQPTGLGLDERARELVRVALESQDPPSMRAAAQMLDAQGFAALATGLRARADAEDAEQGTPEPDESEDDPLVRAGLSPTRLALVGTALDVLICLWFARRQRRRHTRSTS